MYIYVYNIYYVYNDNCWVERKNKLETVILKIGLKLCRSFSSFFVLLLKTWRIDVNQQTLKTKLLEAPAESYFENHSSQYLQTRHLYSTLKRRGNDRFHYVSTWNTCGAFVRMTTSWGVPAEISPFFEKIKIVVIFVSWMLNSFIGIFF